MNKQTYVLYCFGGWSGAGKDTQADLFLKRFGMKKVKSVATRQPRYDGEATYYFITDEEYDAADLCQHAGFSGCRYGATVEEVDNSSIFVLCPEGLPELMSCYTKRPIVVLYLDTTDDTRREHMAARGDPKEAIETLIKHDAEHYGTFSDAAPIHVIDGNRDIESVFNDMVAIMRSYEPNRDWNWKE